MSLLTQTAHIRASLFNFNFPLTFATDWFLPQLFEQKPKSFPIPVAPTRDFVLLFLYPKSKQQLGTLAT